MPARRDTTPPFRAAAGERPRDAVAGLVRAYRMAAAVGARSVAIDARSAVAVASLLGAAQALVDADRARIAAERERDVLRATARADFIAGLRVAVVTFGALSAFVVVASILVAVLP